MAKQGRRAYGEHRLGCDIVGYVVVVVRGYGLTAINDSPFPFVLVFPRSRACWQPQGIEHDADEDQASAPEEEPLQFHPAHVSFNENLIKMFDILLARSIPPLCINTARLLATLCGPQSVDRWGASSCPLPYFLLQQSLFCMGIWT